MVAIAEESKSKFQPIRHWSCSKNVTPLIRIVHLVRYILIAWYWRICNKMLFLSLKCNTSFRCFSQTSTCESSSWNSSVRKNCNRLEKVQPSRFNSRMSFSLSWVLHTIHCLAGRTRVSVQVLQVTCAQGFATTKYVRKKNQVRLKQ